MLLSIYIESTLILQNKNKCSTISPLPISILTKGFIMQKGDKFSILSNSIVELNQLKLRIKDLEQRNKMLMNEVTQHPCEDYSSMTYGDEKICNFNCISSKSHRKCKRNLELPAVLRCNPKNWLVNLWKVSCIFRTHSDRGKWHTQL